MRRRWLIGFGGTALIAWPLVARAQQRVNSPRLGFLGFGTPAAQANRVAALRAGLRDLGYFEGTNLGIEFRWAATVEQLKEAAADLVAMKVDVIFATSSTETEPAKLATTVIPIVFATHADPVGLGHVASLSRPGGSITGLSVVLTELAAKGTEILKETVPNARRLGVLWTPTAPSGRLTLQAAENASEKLGIQVVGASVVAVEDFAGAFAAMARNRVDAVFVHASTLTARVNRALLAELALSHRFPTMFGIKENVEAGGLMRYAADLVDLTRRSASYIDKILKGAKPAELPVEQASRYQLVINLRTASALRLAIPQSILARADEVIE
jgi:putative tryptophan/tyrosine transport system substrate-binding protein